MNPTLLVRRQQHATCTATTALEFSPARENEKAGLVIFQNEHHYYLLCASIEDAQPVVQVYRSVPTGEGEGAMVLLASHPIRRQDPGRSVTLRIDARENYYACAFAVSPGQWVTVKDSMDASFLSTRVAGGFVGCMFGIYGTSLGNVSNSTVDVDWFEYTGNDAVYRMR
jgi:alpha-N-arabinofuranosidase